jgi:hypothetical protein
MSAAGAAAAVAVDTLAFALKERMVLMSDKLDTKKEIDEFYKNAMKELAEEKKNKKAVAKADVKADVKPKKPPKKKLDENGEEKPKRPPSAYNIFMAEMQKKMKETHPELSNTEKLTKIGEEWQKHKATLAGVVESDEDVLPVPEPVVEKVKETKKVTIVLDEVTAPTTDEVAPVAAEPVVEPVVEPVADVKGKAKKPVRKAIAKKKVPEVDEITEVAAE